MKKKVISVIAAAALALGLAACGGGQSAPAADAQKEAEATVEKAAEEVKTEVKEAAAEAEKAVDEAKEEAKAEVKEEAEAEAAVEKAVEGATPKIAFVGKVEGQAWWDHVKESVMQWKDETGVDIVYQAPAEVDAAAQVQIMTDLVNQGSYDALLFSPNDPAACEAICKQAKDAGMIVIATEASGMENVNYDVEAFDEKGLGAFLMDQLATQMGEEGEYVTMVGSLTMESQNNWADAAIARAEEAYPNMTYLDERVVDDSDADVAYNKTKELIQKYPDLKGILGTGSFDAPGAARAIQEMGLTGQVFAISVAMPSEVADYIADGTLQSVALWDAGITAQAMCNLAVKMFQEGHEVTAPVDLLVDGYRECDVDGTVIVGDGQIAINSDNIDYWLEVGL
jgi:simple sugar transport system substrate-binding protein